MIRRFGGLLNPLQRVAYFATLNSMRILKAPSRLDRQPESVKIDKLRKFNWYSCHQVTHCHCGRQDAAFYLNEHNCFLTKEWMVTIELVAASTHRYYWRVTAVFPSSDNNLSGIGCQRSSNHYRILGAFYLICFCRQPISLSISVICTKQGLHIYVALILNKPYITDIWCVSYYVLT